MKDLQYLTVLAGSGSKVLAWRSRPVADVSCLSDNKSCLRKILSMFHLCF